jgi:hypothetical protein
VARGVLLEANQKKKFEITMGNPPSKPSLGKPSFVFEKFAVWKVIDYV